MQISALGPLAIDGRPVEGARLPAVLFPLLLARGRIVPAGDLVEAVWDGAPPDDPVGALRALVSRTRRLGLTVTAAAGGYRLDPQDVEVDLLLAQDARAQARTALAGGDSERAGLLAARALALWPDAGGSPAVGPWGRLFRDLLSIRVEGELARPDGGPVPRGGGGYRRPDDPGALETLQDAVRRLPTDEPLATLLMRALAAGGREAEAFAVYERLRRELAQTYGADPSAVVAGTHLALLRGELPGRDRRPSDAPAPPPVTAGPRTPPRPAGAARRRRWSARTPTSPLSRSSWAGTRW